MQKRKELVNTKLQFLSFSFSGSQSDACDIDLIVSVVTHSQLREGIRMGTLNCFASPQNVRVCACICACAYIQMSEQG